MLMGSAPCMIVIAITMVMIRGTAASLVAKPAKMSTEQKTSAKTVNPRESSGLIPSTDGNCTGDAEKSRRSLGMPCVNINAAIPTLAVNSARPEMTE